MYLNIYCIIYIDKCQVKFVKRRMKMIIEIDWKLQMSDDCWDDLTLEEQDAIMKEVIKSIQSGLFRGSLEIERTEKE